MVALARPIDVAGAPRATPHLGASGLSIAYTARGRRQTVLHDVDIEIPRGAFVSLIGASGCGKSTLLKAFAGLVEPAAGTIEVAGLTPREAVKRRLVGLVFQDATLLPWKSLLDNTSFLLEIADKALGRRAARARAYDMLRLVGLEGAADKRPGQLSGGMRQRAAIARALTLDPEILLMDEPFGALDAITREAMSLSLLDIWERTGKTIVLVTHSIDEAVLLSSEVHVMGLRPARIVETLAVELPRPRGEQSYGDPRFGVLEQRLRAQLLHSHAHRGDER
jgi:NitT/TauT family transport system ATP-binding protein